MFKYARNSRNSCDVRKMCDRYTATIRWSCNKTIADITSLYLPEGEFLVEPEDIEKAPRIKDTLQVYMVKRLFDIRKVPNLELFNLATNKKPFLLQHNCQYTTCGQRHNSIDNNHCGFCLANSKSNEEWFHFPVCVVWLHNGCFRMGLHSNAITFLYFYIW